ncbi:hypothetical protein C8Q76DRAFT_605511, partial [Earliella scabrosa]
PRVISFDPVDGNGRVVEEDAAMKVLTARREAGVALDRAASEALSFLRLRANDSLRVPKDVQDALTICRASHFTILKLNYDNRRLTEYILHLHSVFLADRPHSYLPPIPAEIACYVDVTRNLPRSPQ